ncbi:hypothetical protein niasHT_015116 [Heterodera trifolii]|uniref:HAT C-terminal dimerisation domain-containing protein n=1 Tax=Heterodera trifolii TaxID=157864 RepID=A0ABD2L9T7_9BILA
MAPPKRKSFFKSEYSNEFQGITKSKTGDEFAHCIPCNFDISLVSTGKAAIPHHLKTEKHKKAAKAANSALAITAFMPSTSAPTNLDRPTAAAEVSIALQEIAGVPFSISIDSSNHKTIKLFPLVVRYFKPKSGISVKVVDLEALSGETSAEIYDWIMKILGRHKLDIAQLVAFCGDNVNANFGGAELAGQRNIYTKLKAHRNNLIPNFETKDLAWISLKEKKVPRAEVMSLAEQIAPELNDNELFDEITTLNETLETISDEKFGEMNAEQKWMKLFEAKLPNLLLLVSKILSIPVSNACVERVFSLCSAQWTDVRNSLKVETVKSLAQIKLNYDLTCPEMYDLLISSPKLLKMIMGENSVTIVDQQRNKRIFKSLCLIICVNIGGYYLHIAFRLFILPLFKSPITNWVGFVISAIPLIISAISNAPILYITSSKYRNAFDYTIKKLLWTSAAHPSPSNNTRKTDNKCLVFHKRTT